jgi:glycosyltransferase involved in cell wall biosynthesis
LKILLVSNGFPPSGQWGTEFYTHQLATGLLQSGDEVFVFHPLRDSSRARFSIRRETRYGVKVIEIANNGDRRKNFADSYRCEGIERAFEQLLEEECPEVVHFMHLFWGLSVRLPEIAQRYGARTVVTPTDFGLVCHRGQLVDWRMRNCTGQVTATDCARCVREPGEWDLAPARRRAQSALVNGIAMLGGLARVVTREEIEERQQAVREATRAVDHWIFPTQTLQSELRVRGIQPDAATQLYYGLDESEYQGAREALGSSCTRFVYMSQYMPHKGLSCLMEACRLLQSRLPESVAEWSVDLYGNGTGARHKRYASEILGSPLPRRVTDHGPFEPLRAPEILASTDCVLVPSEWRENAPLTVLQARAGGVPVIASDMPGISEIVEHGKHGLLFPAGDARALAAAMGRVIAGELPVYRPSPVIPWGEHIKAVRATYRGADLELQPESALDLELQAK